MRFGPEDMTPPPEHDLRPARPAQLQINQTGSWRGALDFDQADTPPELLAAADQMARLCGQHTTMRLVARVPNGSGGLVATRFVLMHWSREKGWVKS